MTILPKVSKTACSLFGAVLVAGFAWCFFSFRGKALVSPVRFVPLQAIQGISPEVIKAQGTIVNIAEPVQFFPATGIYLFEVTVHGNTFEFAGDAAKILHFIKEIRFLNSNSVDWSDKSWEVLMGGRDAVASMVESLWNVIHHPIDTVSGLESAATGIYDYAGSYVKGTVNPTEDFASFAEAYFNDKCMDVANERNLNFQELETTQAKAVFINLAKYKIGGRLSVEVLTLFLTFTKVTKVASLTKLGRYGSLFRFEAMAEIGASRVAKFSEAVRDISNLERLAPLLNPQRIATLTADNALNGRLNKVMYYLRREELAGGNVSESLWRSMKMAGADKPFVGPKCFVHSKMDHAQLLNNYKNLKDVGVFDIPQNMESLRRGGRAVAGGGRSLDVNHIIPKSLAPELKNRWFNLEYMDSSRNRSLGNSLTKVSREKLSRFQKAGALTSDRAKQILVNAGE